MRLTEGNILESLRQSDNKEYKKLISLRKHNIKEYKSKMQFWITEFKDQDNIVLDSIIAPSKIGDTPVLYQDNYYSTNILKKLSHNIIEKEGKLRFIINKNFVVEGKVLPSKMEYKENVVLMRANKKSDDFGNYIYNLFFIDDYAKNTKINAGECFSYFHIYDLTTTDGLRYRLLSETKLAHEVYILEGTLFLINDFPDIGYKTQTRVKMPVLFLHKDGIHPIISKYKTHNELFKSIKKYKLTKERLWEHLFYHQGQNYSFMHPDYFMEIISAFLFSAKYEGYPLHLLVICHAGVGKSTFEECLHDKLEDYQAIVEGSGSTIKKLVPSFKSTTPTQGALMTSSRLSVVDEFLRILMRVPAEDRQNQLSMLNPLLEHKSREFGSGNCTIQGSMTAKMLGVSNPLYGSHSMTGICEYIDRSFLSRIFIWYMDNDHIKGIQDRITRKINKFQVKRADFLAIFDYFQTFQANFDENRVKIMVNEKRELVLSKNPDLDLTNVLEVYNARYLHHACCLLDGIIKTRCLCENDMTFKAIEKDYYILNNILYIMLINWKLL